MIDHRPLMAFPSRYRESQFSDREEAQAEHEAEERESGKRCAKHGHEMHAMRHDPTQSICHVCGQQ